MVSLGAGTVIKLMEKLDLENLSEACPLATCFNQCFLKGLTPCVGEKALAAHLLFNTSPNRPWVEENALVLAQSEKMEGS